MSLVEAAGRRTSRRTHGRLKDKGPASERAEVAVDLLRLDRGGIGTVLRGGAQGQRVR